MTGDVIRPPMVGDLLRPPVTAVRELPSPGAGDHDPTLSELQRAARTLGGRVQVVLVGPDGAVAFDSDRRADTPGGV